MQAIGQKLLKRGRNHACNILNSKTLLECSKRLRHSMTNLYETLGVHYDASNDEIENAYKRLTMFFDPKNTKQEGKSMADDPIMKIYFDDISLAYKTLSNSASRAEYDEYISQNQRVQNYWNSNKQEEEDEDPEVIAERERRRKERGKKRFEEDYSFVNEEFFSSWQNRTNNFKSGADGSEKSIEAMFNGCDAQVEVEATFAEVMQEGGVEKSVSYMREVLCGSCNGSRERAGSESLPCYSCKGEGVKEDAIFRKQTRCNTCKGHGKLI